MERIVIKAKNRDLKTKSAKLRASGFVPAVIYNHGKTDHIEVLSDDIRKLFVHGISESQLYDLDIDGKTETAFVKDFQMHPVTEQVLHIDFYRVTFGEKIKTHIPIHLEGKPAGLIAGGVLETFLHEVEIETFPRYLTPALNMDISHLQIGEAIHTDDLPLPPDTKILIEGNPIVCHIAKPAKLEVTEETA